MSEDTQQPDQDPGKAAGWEPRVTGTLDDGTVITARNGTGENEGQTLVGAGELSASEFDAAHDHYGTDPSKENDKGNLDNAPNVSDLE